MSQCANLARLHDVLAVGDQADRTLRLEVIERMRCIGI